jgi:hypothetical protein
MARGMVSGVEYFLTWIGVENLFPHSACIIRRSAAISCSGYPLEILNSDVAMLLSVLLEGEALAVDELVSYWRFHGGNGSKIAEFEILLQNFDAILIPYRRGLAQNIPLTFWLMKNTRIYLVSSFHQITGSGGEGCSLFDYLKAFAQIFCMLASKSLLALLGGVTAAPKIFFLIFFRRVIGHNKFSQIMVRRGNYVYFTKELD